MELAAIAAELGLSIHEARRLERAALRHCRDWLEAHGMTWRDVMDDPDRHDCRVAWNVPVFEQETNNAKMGKGQIRQPSGTPPRIG